MPIEYHKIMKNKSRISIGFVYKASFPEKVHIVRNGKLLTFCIWM